VVRQEDRAEIRGVRVVAGEGCVPGHRLLVMDMRFEATKGRRGKFEPRVRVWRLREEGTCEEFGCMVGDRVEEVEWRGLGVDDHWQQMKGVVMETAQDICGVAEGVPGHREAWWWSGGVAEAVGNGRVKYGKWKREGAEGAGMECGGSGRDAERVVSSAGERRRREWAGDLSDSECQSGIFRRARRMVGEGQDVTGLDCVEGASGRVVVDDGGIKDCWRECMERLVGGENEWGRGMSAGVGEGPADCVGVDGVRAALKRMKKHGAPGLSGLVTEMMRATGDAGAQWILDLCNGVVKEGSVPGDWRSGVVLPVCRGRGDPMECGSYRGIKLLEHAMKVVEGIFGRGVRRRIGIDGMRFGFMGGEGTTDVGMLKPFIFRNR